MRYGSLVLILALLTQGCDRAPPPQPPPAMGPVPPGQYVNHVGNPAAGYWGPGGNWQWHNPEGQYANETWKYLAAAGLAAGAATYFTKRHFERKYGGTWRSEPYVLDHYTDHRGQRISETEYQSRRDRKVYIDRKGKEISEAEYLRRREQSARDRAKAKAKKTTSTSTSTTTSSTSKPTPYTDYKNKQKSSKPTPYTDYKNKQKSSTSKPYSRSKSTKSRPYSRSRKR